MKQRKRDNSPKSSGLPAAHNPHSAGISLPAVPFQQKQTDADPQKIPGSTQIFTRDSMPARFVLPQRTGMSGNVVQRVEGAELEALKAFIVENAKRYKLNEMLIDACIKMTQGYEGLEAAKARALELMSEYPLASPEEEARGHVMGYRAQGGIGHESVGIIKYGPGGPVDPENMEKQLNLAIGDVLHSRYFAAVKRQGNANIISLQIDNVFFYEWIVAASVDQHRANQKGAELFTPPEGQLAAVIEPALKKFAQDHKGNEEVDIKGALGPWAEGMRDKKGRIKPISPPRIGDYKQPSYKVEMQPPWPFVLSLFSRVTQEAKPAHEYDRMEFDPPEIRDPKLLEQQILKLLLIAQVALKAEEDKERQKKQEMQSKKTKKGKKGMSDDLKEKRAWERQLRTLLDKLAAERESPSAANNYDDGIYSIYNEFGRIKRAILPPESWFKPID